MSQQEFEKLVRGGDLCAVKEFLKQNPEVDPSDDNNYAFRMAASSGFVDMVKFFLEDDHVDPSDDNDYALRYAIEYNRFPVAEVLIKDPRVSWKSCKDAVWRLCTYNKYELLRVLLREKDYVWSTLDATAFKTAVYLGHKECFMAFFEDDIGIGRLTQENLSHLFVISSISGWLDVIQMLLKTGLWKYQEGDDKALVYAKRYEHDDIYDILLKDGRLNFQKGEQYC